MHKVLSHQLWKHVGNVARKAKQRQAAIAYVTKDLIGFRKGDVLVVDASKGAISAGETNAQLLAKLTKRGAALFSCPGLHAKVLLLDDVAVVGSGNMSESSRSALVEAAVMTDATGIVSNVASLIEQLRQQSIQLNNKSIQALVKIKVVRRGFGLVTLASTHKRPKVSELGTQTWLLGVFNYDRELKESEQQLIDKTRLELAKKLGCDDESIDWIKWSGSGPFVSKSRQGDQVIQIWCQNSKSKHPSSVLRPTALLLKKNADGNTYAFMRDAKGKYAKLKWGVFKKLMKRLGYQKKFGPYSQVVLDSELADNIGKHWKTA